MKLGFKIPSFKRSLSARTSLKRYVRHNLGFKMPRGLGFLTSPKKFLYNKTYNLLGTGAFSTRTKSAKSYPSAPSPSLLTVTPSPKHSIDDVGRVIRSSSRALQVTSHNFKAIREEISAIYELRKKIKKELMLEQLKYYVLTLVHWLSFLLVFGFFYKKIYNFKEGKKLSVQGLKQQLSEAYVNISYENDQIEKSWLNVRDAFLEALKSEKLWDLMLSKNVDRARERSAAETSWDRKLIAHQEKELEFIKSETPPLFIPNANGPGLYLYPTFLILFKSQQELGIFDLKEVETTFRFSNFIEEEKVPADTEVIGETWKKTNKDGSQDKRFKQNYLIPIVRYGSVKFHSLDGLEEAYMFSKGVLLSELSQAYDHHISLINQS